MKPIPCLVLAALLPALASAVPAGRGDLSLAVSAGGSYDSHPGGPRASGGDWFGTLTPKLGYTRRAGRIEAEAGASVAFVRYLDRSEADADNAQLNAGLRLAEAAASKVTGRLEGAYTETNEVNADLNARLGAATTHFSALAAWRAGTRTNFGFDADYLRAANSGASDAETRAAGLDWAYQEFLHDTSLFSAYRYQEATTSGRNRRGVALDQTSHQATLALGRPLYREVYGRIGTGYRVLERAAAETASGERRRRGVIFSAGVDGPFLPRRYFPKVKSRAGVTYEAAATPGIDDRGAEELGADVSIVWEAGPRTTVSFAGNREQRLSVLDITVVSTGLRTVLAQKLRHNVDASVSAGYNWETFRGFPRSDRRTTLAGELTYRLGDHWHADASYRFEDVSSDVAGANYDRHLVSLSLGWSL